MSAGAVVPISMAGVVLDSLDAHALAEFYRQLLGWKIGSDEEGWVTLIPPDGGTGLSFATEPAYKPPTWPSDAGRQQMMIHVDFQVEDLDAAQAHAVTVGATLTSWQPQPDVRVLTDPAGHPFCLFTR
jgi:predicted enzyme related to lactoylglutathione lyase